jgi:hypothetical protein
MVAWILEKNWINIENWEKKCYYTKIIVFGDRILNIDQSRYLWNWNIIIFLHYDVILWIVIMSISRSFLWNEHFSVDHNSICQFL